MQKVVVVNVFARPDEDTRYTEIEFEKINKLLDEGYKVIQFYQIAPSHNLYSSTLTFVLEKRI